MHDDGSAKHRRCELPLRCRAMPMRTDFTSVHVSYLDMLAEASKRSVELHIITLGYLRVSADAAGETSS